MNGKLSGKWFALIAAAGLLQGCTAALWEQGDCRPALDPQLRLYEVGDKVLVQYNEMREEHDDLKRRNFFLNENTNAIAQERAPIFFDAKKSQMTNPIPLFRSPQTNSGTSPIYATSEYDNGNPFFIVRDGKKFGPYELPIYSDKTRHGAMRRAVLTPLSVATDAAALGGLLALTAWEQEEKERAERNSQPQLPYESPRKKK